MPKVIENVRKRLLAEAEKQINENGYAKTTVRSVAGACGLAVGTVYNYFPSKEMLVASFVAEDWGQVTARLHALPYQGAKERLCALYNALQEFAARHSALFSDHDALATFSATFRARHPLLRAQLSALILPLCGAYPEEEQAFAAEFVAEALLVWTMAEKPFDEIYTILKNTLKM